MPPASQGTYANHFEGRELLDEREVGHLDDVVDAHLQQTVTMHALVSFSHLVTSQEKTHRYMLLKKLKGLIFNGNSFKTFEIIVQAQQHMSLGCVWLAVCLFSTSF